MFSPIYLDRFRSPDRSRAKRPTPRAGCLTGRFLPRHGVRDRLPDYLPRSSFWHVGTSVVLPIGLPVSGEILTNHVHSIDTLARPIGYAGAAVPAEILHEVRMKLVALIGL